MNKTQAWSRFLMVWVVVVTYGRVASGQYLVMAAGLSKPDFRAAGAVHPEFRRLSESAPENVAALDVAKENLNRALERAQAAYLSGTLQDARARFSEVIGFAMHADWARAQRKAVHFAYLRLAQLSPAGSAQRGAALAKAIAFGSDLKADPDQFPPPFLAELEKAKRDATAKSVTIQVRERFAGFDSLSVNGRVYNVAETGKLTFAPGDYRIHLRSDVFAPVTEVMSAAKIFIYSAPRKPLATGTCASPTLSEAKLASLELVIVYGQDCLQRYRSGKWTRVLPPGLETPGSDLWAKQPVLDSRLEIPDRPVEPKPFYRKGWFWLSVAGVAAASVALSAKRSGERSEAVVAPSSAEGF